MTTIILSAILVLFFQIIHMFEEIALKAYSIKKVKNPLGVYLRVCSGLVLIGFLIVTFLILKYEFAYFIAFFLVFISIGNTVAHVILHFKNKGKLGYGLPSSIPLGIAGLNLLWQLIKHII